MDKDNKELLIQLQKQLKISYDLLEKTDKIIRGQDEQISKLKEKTITYNRIEKTDKWYDFKEVAKLLGYKQKNKSWGRNTILGFLRDKKIFMDDNEPYQNYVNSGLFKITLKYIEAIDETKKIPLASLKGIDFIRKLIDEEVNETI